MAICPKCKATIEYLVEWCPELVPYRACLDKGGELDYTGKDMGLESEPTGSSVAYTCPECGDEVAETTQEALTIMKGA